MASVTRRIKRNLVEASTLQRGFVRRIVGKAFSSAYLGERVGSVRSYAVMVNKFQKQCGHLPSHLQDVAWNEFLEGSSRTEILEAVRKWEQTQRHSHSSP